MTTKMKIKTCDTANFLKILKIDTWMKLAWEGEVLDAFYWLTVWCMFSLCGHCPLCNIYGIQSFKNFWIMNMPLLMTKLRFISKLFILYCEPGDGGMHLSSAPLWKHVSLSEKITILFFCNSATVQHFQSIQCGVIIMHYFFSKTVTKDTHSLPVKARYGMSSLGSTLIYTMRSEVTELDQKQSAQTM